jgi:hypothetical protein
VTFSGGRRYGVIDTALPHEAATVPRLKGEPYTPFLTATGPGDSDETMDLRDFNAVVVKVIVTGTNPKADILLIDSESPAGNFLACTDPQGAMLNVTSSTQAMMICGAHFARIRLANVSGVFAYGQGFTVIVWPFVAAGQSTINVGTIAIPGNVNLAQSGGVAIGAGNPVPEAIIVGGAAVAPANPLPEVLYLGGALVGLANPLPQVLSLGGALVSAANLLPVTNTPLLGSVQRTSAGFTAPGQSAKSYVGSIFTPAADPPPGAATVATGAAGVLTGAYTYKVTFVTAQGETQGGTTSAVVNPAAQQVNLSAIPVGVATLPVPVTARRIYRSKAGGPDGFQQLVGTLADNATTVFVDNVADGALGVQVPLRNTSAVLSVALTTVTALKTWILTDILLTCDAAAQVLVRLQAAGADIFRGLVRDIEPLAMPGIETQPNAGAGQAITLLVNGTSTPQELNFILEAIEQ